MKPLYRRKSIRKLMMGKIMYMGLAGIFENDTRIRTDGKLGEDVAGNQRIHLNPDMVVELCTNYLML